MGAYTSKIAPCPNCKTDENVAVYGYESGWHHVECNKCWYLGPGMGTAAKAIKSHNEQAGT
jgi:Zn ribbon nucleic-acid-binding protein